MTRRFPLLTTSLFLSLHLSLLSAACGSPRAQPAIPQAAGASGTPEAQAGAGESTSGEGVVDPTDFCERYKGMYCTYDEDGESSYDELSAEQQREVMEECEKAVREADEEMFAAMEECLGCVGDCSSVNACLQGASLCVSDDDEEAEYE